MRRRLPCLTFEKLLLKYSILKWRILYKREWKMFYIKLLHFILSNFVSSKSQRRSFEIFRKSYTNKRAETPTQSRVCTMIAGDNVSSLHCLSFLYVYATETGFHPATCVVWCRRGTNIRVFARRRGTFLTSCFRVIITAKNYLLFY